jgi:5-methylcytosine-specific restriction endonuclease McrA
MPFANRPLGWAKTVRRIIERDRGICWICGLPGANSADHLIPRSKGGNHSDANLAAAHMYCNRQRGNRDMAGTIGHVKPKVTLPRARVSRWR